MKTAIPKILMEIIRDPFPIAQEVKNQKKK
jgi:hypothetical protein